MKTSENQYLEYIEEQLPNIFNLYKKFEDKKPVMLFDVQEQKIYAYPYNDFKSDLSIKSQTILEEQYSDSLLNNMMVVFIRDNEKSKLISASYALE